MAVITPEMVDKALALIESGETETAACASVGISRGGFRSAALKFARADYYARATEALARDQVEKLEAVIDEMRRGEIPADVARIEIDARKWIASKLFKPTWGDRLAAEVTGPAGGPVVISWGDPQADGK